MTMNDTNDYEFTELSRELARLRSFFEKIERRHLTITPVSNHWEIQDEIGILATAVELEGLFDKL